MADRQVLFARFQSPTHLSYTCAYFNCLGGTGAVPNPNPFPKLREVELSVQVNSLFKVHSFMA